MNQTNKKTGKRAFAFIISVMVVFSITAGCGKNNDSPAANSVNEKVHNEGTTNDSTTGGINSSGGTDSNVVKPEPTVPTPPANDDKTEPSTKPTASAEKQGEGTYIGQADTNSIEIKTKEGTTSVFQVDDKMSEKVSQIADDAAVTFTYVEKEINDGSQKIKQLWLISIKVG
ncbi:hypothetical protein Back11_61240 [Paenibacillus baekrokdamisoli]|uniref:Uncharacterized protein n=1 Tax=Paenibacillus baekrokdamisoli TaxID=1712516 RepID=A0A3G9JP00_9BACL|nr:hypothetical protein [Paenibacillus baekrokdamisoli]MBB3072196.1 hypothetical protein [Paenibacillus baekrokdamisoli]BBH24779.1 hypothetical protein Back11_61240 [Paenibacillus baekrokdamisoli]